jgi:hypothetical protein
LIAEPEEQETTDESESAEGTPFENLSEAACSAIEGLVTGCLKEELSADHGDVRRAWQQRAFKNGIQHLWYDDSSHCFMLPSASPEEVPAFMDVYNIYTPHWRSFVSILSQNPPGVNFVPNDLQSGRDVTAANYAEKLRHHVDRLVHMKDAQMEAASLFCTDGRTVAWTFVDPKTEKLCVDIAGVLEWKVPIYVRKMAKWSYAIHSVEHDKWELKEEFPDFADDIDGADDTSAESNYRRYARLMVLGSRRGGSSDALKSITTRHDAWIRPWRYKKAPDTVQDEIAEAFPEGLRATVICGKLVNCVEETMESCLRVEWPAPGQGQIRPSMLHDLVPVQEAFNDIMNMIREFGEYSIPARWVTDTLDSEAIAEQVSAPGITHQLTVPTGAAISDLVFIEPTAALPADIIANTDRLLTLAQFTTGDLPSLFGGGTPDQETASGQKMLSDQAKGQLSPAWAGVQWLFAGIYEIAIKLAAKMAPQSIAIEGNSGQDKFDPAAILQGDWGCYPDTDSSFPESMSDKRASLQMVLSQVGQADPTIVTQPDNLKLIKQYSGLTDLVIPGAEARDKQLEEIEQLLQESPVPDTDQMPQWEQAAQQAQANGQPAPLPPLKSSMGIGRYDFDQPEFDKCKEWLSSTACREEQRKGNLPGIQNVELHASLHEQRMQQNAQANAPKPEPPKVSITAAVTDPNAVSQLLGEVGVQTTPDDITADKLPEMQNQAADTQLKAASAQHKAVLAAKEAVAPVKSPNSPQVPDVPGQGEVNVR